jgi:pyruvate/2-oxoglutarate dehydrogenase complex dihydrolipoamide dehydrogenase (E3) component
VPDEKKQYDLVVIGGGAGGLVVASGAAQLGARVAVVERAHGLGGDCLYFGCVPTKSLVHVARMASLIRRSEEFGLGKTTISDNLFEGAMERMRRMVEKIGEHDDPKRFQQMGIDLHFGEGKFIDSHTFEVNGRPLHGRRFVLATGSRAAGLPIPGLEEAGYLTHVTALQLQHRPASMAILGAGPTGIEFAQIFQRLGVKVTLIEKEERILPKEDRDVAILAEKILVKEGIRFVKGGEILKVEKEAGQKILSVKTQTGIEKVISDEILVAVGRAPNVEGLNLQAAGVAYDQKRVQVNSTLRTTARNIWACGDLVGPYQFTHMAEYQAGIVVANSLFPFVRRKVDYRVVPSVTFSDPEIARVGLTEEEAEKEGRKIHVYRFPFKEVDRAIIEGEEEGFIKLITDDRLRIIGAHLIGPHAGDLLHEYVVAMKANLKITQLSTTVHVYPTLSQGVKKAADQYYREKLFSGWFPKLARWLIRF